MEDEKTTSSYSGQFIKDCKEQFQNVSDHLLQNSKLSQEEAHDIVENLFLRLLFLRFLEEKKWLVYQGNSNYLSALCNAGGIGLMSVYSSRFKPLFSKGLSVKGHQENETYGSVLLMNLDLFFESSLDGLKWDFSDEIMLSLTGREGLFYNYNFSMDEFDSSDSINPEIIGTLFEELMLNRQHTGVFYTPKPVVRYMCDEGIILILEERTNLTLEQIRNLVDKGSIEHLSPSQIKGLKHELLSIKAIDHACGSGAYLIGLLEELLRIYETLSFSFPDVHLSRFDLKYQLISQSIFGIDIDPKAVTRTMCRLWLSLATDSVNPLTTSSEIFNLEAMDSLLGPGPKCVQDVQSTNGGFDLVLANPPYVRHGHIDSDYKQELLQQYASLEPSPVDKTSDLYCYFFARANEFLRPDGVQIFICSNSWLDSRFGNRLQQYLLTKTHIISLIDSRKKKQFSDADINTIVSIIRKSKPKDTNFVMLEGDFYVSIESQTLRNVMTISQQQLFQSGLDSQGIYGGQRLSLFHRAPRIYFQLIDALKPQSCELQQLAQIRRGPSTGANEFFFMNEQEIEMYDIEEEFLHQILRRPAECQSIRTSLSNRSEHLFSCSRSKESIAKSSALSYIHHGESKGYHQASTCRSRKFWYNVNPSDAAHILWMETMGSSHRVCLNDFSITHSDKFYGITLIDDTVDAVKLCVWLNSSPIILHKLLTSFNSLGLGALKTPVYEVKKIPVPDFDSLHFEPEVLESFLQRPIQDVVSEMSMPDRIALEEPIMKLLGFSKQQEDAIRQSIMTLMVNRLDKASS